MGLRDRIEVVFVGLLDVLGPYGLLVLAAALALTLALILGATLRRRVADESRPARTVTLIETSGDAGLDDLTPEPEDRMLPLGRFGFLVLVVALAAGCWTLGFFLAKDKSAFLGSREWHFQPFYIAAHLATLRLFVALFTRNYRQGIANMNAPAEQALAGMHRILGPLGALWAFVIALPFCASDYRYLHGPKYEKLDPSASIQAIDYTMWGIWCVEWFLNAFIWVILAGFLLRNVRTLRDYQFVAPIEIVLQDKHYRPFLRMSSQGAGVVFGFGIMTALYITYTGGNITDYLGLIVTGVLLVVGFLVPWFLLRRNVRAAVEVEQRRLQDSMNHDGSTLVHALGTRSAAEPDLRGVSERLDYVVSHLRISHLERLHLKLGATEARAVAIRLLAPAATVGWQLAQNYKPVIEQFGRILQPVISRIGG
jgi:hypothetical protein